MDGCPYCNGHQIVTIDGEAVWGPEWRGFKVRAVCRYCVRWLWHGGV